MRKREILYNNFISFLFVYICLFSVLFLFWFRIFHSYLFSIDSGIEMIFKIIIMNEKRAFLPWCWWQQPQYQISKAQIWKWKICLNLYFQFASQIFNFQQWEKSLKLNWKEMIYWLLLLMSMILLFIYLFAYFVSI